MSEKQSLEVQNILQENFEEDDDLETKDYDIDSDSESDEEDDIKKLENSVDKNLLLNYHPEVLQINYNEMHTLCKIIRNKNGTPIDPLHKTIPFLTKYEKSKVLGLRAKQINSGSEIFVEIPPNIYDGYTIANLELKQKKIPFIIRRPLPNGTSEYWKVNDLQQF